MQDKSMYVSPLDFVIDIRTRIYVFTCAALTSGVSSKRSKRSKRRLSKNHEAQKKKYDSYKKKCVYGWTLRKDREAAGEGRFTPSNP